MKTAKPLMESYSVDEIKALQAKKRAPGQTARGTMNRTEAEFAARLEMDKRCGVIKSYGFERIKLKIGERCFFTPDFDTVGTPSGTVRLYEVKGGFIRDDAMVKLKAAASLYPQFEFWLVQKKRRNEPWLFKEIRAT